MKAILLIFSCPFLLCCTTKTRKVITVHSPYDTMFVYAKDETGQKIYNVISEKAVMANGDSLFGKIRKEVPKQLNDKVIYQKGVAGITCEDYRVKFRFLKDLGKERKRLTINLDKGVIVNE